MFRPTKRQLRFESVRIAIIAKRIHTDNIPIHIFRPYSKHLVHNPSASFFLLLHMCVLCCALGKDRAKRLHSTSTHIHREHSSGRNARFLSWVLRGTDAQLDIISLVDSFFYSRFGRLKCASGACHRKHWLPYMIRPLKIEGIFDMRTH